MAQRTSAPERFWPKVQKTDTCWLWTASLDAYGYGQFFVSMARRTAKAHRFAYEQAHGEIPAGLEIDHLCRNRACVNPAHLECVTRKVNTLRGEAPSAQNARRTHCIRGHLLPDTPNAARGRRLCHPCKRERRRGRY